MTQQYRNPAVATSTATGTIVITFPSVAVNSVATGCVSVPAAPSGANWQVEVNGDALGAMIGATPFGTMGLQNSDVLTLVGTGVLPNTQYTGVFVGSLVYGQVPTQQIQPQATAILSSSAPDVLYSSLVNLPASGTVTIQNISMPAPYQSVMVVLDNPTNSSVVQAIDSTSGAYFGENGPISGGYQPVTTFGSTYIFPMVNEPGDFLEIIITSGGAALTAVPITVFGVRVPMAVTVQPPDSGGLPVNTPMGQNLDVVEYGGQRHTTVSVGASTQVKVINPPADGTTWRLHSFTCPELSPSNTGVIQLLDHTTSDVFASLSEYLPSFYMGGIIDGNQIDAYNGTAGSVSVTLTYDQVNTPTIG